MKRTASLPTSSTTSRKVTKSPARFDIFTGSQESDELDDFDVERGLLAGDRLHCGLHALDIAAMVGAPNVDEITKAAVELVLVIGDVGGEVGVGAVRLDQRTIDVVAERGGAEQQLLAVLPILDRRSLRRRQAAFIDVAS